MISENELKGLIEKVIAEMGTNQNSSSASNQQSTTNNANNTDTVSNLPDDQLKDITAIKMQDYFDMDTCVNKEEYLKYKAKTPARLGIGRAGLRMKTEPLLRYRADHAVAMDAVFSDVSEDFLKEMNLKTYQTLCDNKDVFLTRPDLGRNFSEETLAEMKKDCENNPTVQVYVSDGLSSTAIEANIRDTLPAIINGLKSEGVKVGTPFFVKYGRVAAEDAVAANLNAEVTCVLIGERPGLATGESMSAYMIYKGYPGAPEAKRTVVSNIHKNGTPAAEAGAHIAGVIKKILDAKASGVDLKL
ncbi:ethanolamine ammonia-lyase subunit EutC [Urinicoccus massiliensis]|uniref:ethanolamine ammonia-lyase subunit EutC n=1 Tax=Urinicoccus massiliensis TaxID=1723382 RepID=UPI000930EAB3|nr:ethanolamine ammonia-lyase subunit EutC [Urinicoccus massiliensis]